MRPYEEMTDERRCEAGAGLHYKSREWDEIFNAGGCWDGAWPEIDRHGNLTGRIVGSEEGFLNVNDEVMISAAEARAGGWTSPDDGYAEPPEPSIVEVATSCETIRECVGLEDHDAIDEACAAYRRAVIDAIEDSGLRWCDPRGQRALHSQWMGAQFTFRMGAIGTFATLTDAQKAAIDAADDAGRAAAQKVIDNAVA